MGLESTRTKRYVQITYGAERFLTGDSLGSKTVVNAMFRIFLTAYCVSLLEHGCHKWKVTENKGEFRTQSNI